MILRVQQGLLDDGANASLSQLCRWFEVSRRTVYYQPTKAAPKVDEQLAAPIKAMIEENPSFGYRTVAHLLRMNKNTVQRIFQLKGWQVRKRAIGHAFKHCRQWPQRPTSVGLQIYAVSGPAKTAGRHWPW